MILQKQISVKQLHKSNVNQCFVKKNPRRKDADLLFIKESIMLIQNVTNSFIRFTATNPHLSHNMSAR